MYNGKFSEVAILLGCDVSKRGICRNRDEPGSLSGSTHSSSSNLDECTIFNVYIVEQPGGVPPPIDHHPFLEVVYDLSNTHGATKTGSLSHDMYYSPSFPVLGSSHWIKIAVWFIIYSPPPVAAALTCMSATKRRSPIRTSSTSL